MTIKTKGTSLACEVEHSKGASPGFWKFTLGVIIVTGVNPWFWEYSANCDKSMKICTDVGYYVLLQKSKTHLWLVQGVDIFFLYIQGVKIAKNRNFLES